jgi:hypothetical protein
MIKLKKYYEEFMRDKSIIVLDYSHFIESISDFNEKTSFKIDYDKHNYEVFKKINEQASFKGIKEIVEMLNKTGLNMYPGKYVPSLLKEK